MAEREGQQDLFLIARKNGTNHSHPGLPAGIPGVVSLPKCHVKRFVQTQWPLRASRLAFLSKHINVQDILHESPLPPVPRFSSLRIAPRFLAYGSHDGPAQML